MTDELIRGMWITRLQFLIEEAKYDGVVFHITNDCVTCPNCHSLRAGLGSVSEGDPAVFTVDKFSTLDW